VPLAIASALAAAMVPLAITAVVSLFPAETVRGRPIEADWRTFTFAGNVAVVAALAATGAQGRLHPFRSISMSLRTLRSSSVSSRFFVLAAQVAIATAVLYFGSLTGRSFQKVESTDLGYSADRLVAFELPSVSADSGWPRLRDVMHRLRQSGLVSAVSAGQLPLQPGRSIVSVSAETPLRPDDLGDDMFQVWVAPNYFATLQIAMLAGRDFSEAEFSQRSRVAVLSRSAAETIGLGHMAVGRHVYVNGVRYQVVGLVGDVRADGADAVPPLLVYTTPRLPLLPVVTRLNEGSGTPLKTLEWHVKDASGIAGPLRIVSAEALHLAQSGAYRSRVILLLWIGALTTLIAGLAIVGAIQDALSRRKRELAIRAALGAANTALVRQLLRGVSLALACGTLIGVLGGAVAARFARSLLFAISPIDFASASIVAAAVSSIGIGAAVSALPGLLHMAPTALREELE
jgi:putative ABC transport system permease protein